MRLQVKTWPIAKTNVPGDAYSVPKWMQGELLPTLQALWHVCTSQAIQNLALCYMMLDRKSVV